MHPRAPHSMTLRGGSGGGSTLKLACLHPLTNDTDTVRQIEVSTDVVPKVGQLHMVARAASWNTEVRNGVRNGGPFGFLMTLSSRVPNPS